MLQNMSISSHNVTRMEEIYSQDVEYIELETNRLDNGIGLHGATFHQSCMSENLLRTVGVRCVSTPVSYHAVRRGMHSLVEDKSTEDSKSAVQ